MSNIIENKRFDEERALYGIKDSVIINCSFDGPADGESAFKECNNIEVKDCYFNLRYPLWHVNKAVISNCEMTKNCRAAIWYDTDVTINKCNLHGIKALRECRSITITDCDISSPEVLWRSSDITLSNTTIEGEYPFFECKNLVIDNLRMEGKYSFQYVNDVTIKNSVLNTKDAFWHCNNVTVYDSVVNGEYLGWYSENLKFVRCKIIGTQPLCYCKGLKLYDCTMEGTDLSFERSEVNATIRGRIEGIKNPISGKIKADEIGDILFEPQYVNPNDTIIEFE